MIVLVNGIESIILFKENIMWQNSNVDGKYKAFIMNPYRI